MGPRIRDGLLSYREDDLDHLVPVGTSAWSRWLDRPARKTFRFEHGEMSFTARREPQRGRWYWYAYRRHGGRLRKVYLGRANDLTLERLEAAAGRLHRPGVGPAALGHDRPPGTGRIGPEHRHNLPSPVSSFVGRQTEIAELRRVLDAARLVTLTGAGGVGKTRLALRVAAEAFDNGTDAVWLVELAHLTDASHVPQAMAVAIGAREAPGQPLLATLSTALSVGRNVLVLDNCEHLVDACAQVVGHLLRTCPDLRILATSREPLAVAGEVVWRVPSLGLPEPGANLDVEDVAQAEAVRLFVERARAIQPGFALTAGNASAVWEVCRRLDSIPLAIELAARRVHVLAPEELAQRLDDRFRLLSGGRSSPPRQQTLRAAVDWSYDLLSSAERRCFARLSVFAGGFSLDAAETVCAGDGIESADVLDLLARLVDRSLVLVEAPGGTGATRYRLLETLRAYGSDRLTERGESDGAHARHAGWLTEHAERAARAFWGPDQGRWLRWAEREHDNVRSVLAWAVEREDAGVAVRLAAALSWAWLVHQRWSEGLDWVQRVLALPPSAPTRERGLLLLNGALPLAIFRGDLTSSRPTGGLGLIQRWLEECLAIGEALADDELVIGTHGFIQLLREFGGDVPGAPGSSPEDVLAVARRIGHAWGERRALETLARHALRRGDLTGAGVRLREAIDSARRDRDGWSLAMALNELGDIERAGGRHDRARPLYEESAGVFADLGLGDQPGLLHNLGYVALAAGDRLGAAARFTQALTRFLRLGERRGMAECLLGLGAVAAAEGRRADAGRLFGAGEAALEEMGARLWPANRPDYERWLRRVRASRAVVDFDRARAEGRALSLEHAASLALEGGSAGASDPPPVARGARLTPREREVARLAAQGLTNREIATVLPITEKTAANHLQHVLEKLDLRTRTQVAARAAEFGLEPAEVPPATPGAPR